MSKGTPKRGGGGRGIRDPVWPLAIIISILPFIMTEPQKEVLIASASTIALYLFSLAIIVGTIAVFLSTKVEVHDSLGGSKE